jgi:hypothetical protein
MADGTILGADNNMAQTFEFPTGQPDNTAVSPWRRLIAELSSRVPGHAGRIAVPSGTTPSCPTGGMNMGP